MVSDTTFAEYLRKWKRARNSGGEDALGYPRINVIHPEHGIGGEDDLEIDSDAELFQRCVESLSIEIRKVFEACHLGLIAETRSRQLSHADRANKLGVSIDAYWRQVSSGKKFISETIDIYLQNLAQ